MVGSLFLQMVLCGTQYRLQMAQTEALGIWYQNEEHDGERFIQYLKDNRTECFSMTIFHAGRKKRIAIIGSICMELAEIVLSVSVHVC